MINKAEPNQENASLLYNINHNNNNNDKKSPRKPLGGGGGTSNSDRLRRDEWSEGAVSSLLEAYEAKWVLRNRAKLKGQDWEDVAKHVSVRANSSKSSSKTQTQCKNKIESMKKRYRSESATGGDTSSWPLYPRIDLLLRGSGSAPPPPQPSPPLPPPAASNPPWMFLVEPSLPPQESQPPPPPPPPHPQDLHVENTAQNSHGYDQEAKEDGMDVKLSDHISDKNAIETDSSTPALLYSDKRKLKPEIRDHKRKRQRKENSGIAETIRWLAEVVVSMEKARMDMMKELEKMRAEAELKRGEMDLKRTEIVANTQLEIAKIFAGICKDVDSSLRIGSRIN